MGQCSLQEGGCGDMWSIQGSEEGSVLSRQSCTEKDRAMWDTELNITNNNKLPDDKFWQQQITINHPCFPQITKDVNRTFPDLPYFAKKNNVGRFERILKKLALYFPHVGYTQGLNFTCGFLLISGCEDEECFRLLAKMMMHDRILAIGLYEDDFPLVKLYCQVFWILLAKKLPSVYTLLKKSYITDDLWLFQWFISLFLYNFPIEFTKKIWDFLICKKEMAAVLIALGIIKSIKKELATIDFQDQIQFLDFVSQFKRIQFCRKNLDITKIFSYANSITKAQIDKAISQTKCYNNIYRIYFSSSTAQQKEQWQRLMEKYEVSRKSFAKNLQKIKCQRPDVFENVEKIILTKHKLYQSELHKSTSYKRSNISLPFSTQTSKSNCINGFQRSGGGTNLDFDFNRLKRR